MDHLPPSYIRKRKSYHNIFFKDPHVLQTVNPLLGTTCSADLKVTLNKNLPHRCVWPSAIHTAEPLEFHMEIET